MSIESEKEILGSIFNDAEKYLHRSLELGLTPQMFTHYGRIFEKMITLSNENRPIVTTSFSGDFKDLTELVDIEQSGAFTVDIDHQIETLVSNYDVAEKLKFIRVFHDQLKRWKLGDPDSIESITSSFLSNIVNSSKKTDLPKGFRTAALERLQFFEDVQTGKIVRRVLNTGNRVLDHALGKYIEAKYITIVAETGKGKSTLSVNIANNMMKRGNRIVYFTQEMTESDIVDKVFGLESRIPWDTYVENAWTSDQWDHLTEIARNLDDHSAIDYAHPDIDDILMRASILIKKNNLDAIFIDYIQQLECRAVRSSKIAEILPVVSKKIMQFTLKHGIPIFVAAQLNRASAEQKDDTELINNIADCSAISKDSSYSIAIRKNKENDERYLVKCKGRHGPRRKLNEIKFEKNSENYITDY